MKPFFISGRNPLHLAARGNYTQTVELLHSVHSHLLDQVDKDGVSLILKFTVELEIYFWNNFEIEHCTSFGIDGESTKCNCVIIVFKLQTFV